MSSKTSSLQKIDSPEKIEKKIDHFISQYQSAIKLFSDKKYNDSLKIFSEILENLIQLDNMLSSNSLKIANDYTPKVKSIINNLEKKIHSNINKITLHIKDINDKNTSNKNDPNICIITNEKSVWKYNLISNRYIKQVEKDLILPLQQPSLYKTEHQHILFFGDAKCGKKFITDGIISKMKTIYGKLLVLDFSKIISENISINDVLKDSDKSLILIEDIHIYSDEKFLSEIYKILNAGCKIIATSSNQKLPDSINKIFTKQIFVSSPDKQEVYQFILFNLFINIAPPQFIHKFSIDLMENKYFKSFNINRHFDTLLDSVINEIVEKKYNYEEISTIINFAFNCCSTSALRNKAFLLEDANIFGTKFTYLTSTLSFRDVPKIKDVYVVNNNEKDIISLTINGNKQKFIIKNKTDNAFFYLSDEKISELYFLEKDSLLEKDVVDVIAEFNVNFTDKIYDPFFSSFQNYLQKTILDLYVFFIENMSRCNPKISSDKEEILKKIPSFIASNQNYLSSLSDKKDIFNLYKISQISDTDTFNNCNDYYIQTIYINSGENIELELKYGNNSTKSIELDKKITSSLHPEDLRDIMIHLIMNKSSNNLFIDDVKTKITIKSIKTLSGFLWKFTFIPEKNIKIQKITVITTDHKVFKPSLNIYINSSIFDLDANYTITNESDIDILQEKYPDEYQEIYREDEETWKYKKIKSPEHLSLLNSTYTSEQKFYLKIYNLLLLLKKYLLFQLTLSHNKRLNYLIDNIGYIIDQSLINTQEYDKEGNWTKLWGLSNNHPEKLEYEETDISPEDDEEVIEYDIHRESIRHSNFFSIDLHLLSDILNVFNIFDTDSLLNIYDKYTSHQKSKFTTTTHKVLLKSKIVKKHLDQHYFSCYLNNNQIYLKDKHNSKYTQYLTDKLLNNKSLYMHLFINADLIGIYHEKQITWHEITEDNHLSNISSQLYTNFDKKISSVFNIFFKNTYQYMNTSYVYALFNSCISSYYNIDDKFTKIFIATLLYNDIYIDDLSNKQVNIIDVINSTKYVNHMINYILNLRNLSDYTVQLKKSRFSEILTEKNIKTEILFSSQNTEHNSDFDNSSLPNVKQIMKTYHFDAFYLTDSLYNFKNN